MFQTPCAQSVCENHHQQRHDEDGSQVFSVWQTLFFEDEKIKQKAGSCNQLSNRRQLQCGQVL